MPHVLLNGAFADADAHLEQFAPDPLCSPQSVVPCHGLDQLYGLSGGIFGVGESVLGLIFPGRV